MQFGAWVGGRVGEWVVRCGGERVASLSGGGEVIGWAVRGAVVRRKTWMAIVLAIRGVEVVLVLW